MNSKLTIAKRMTLSGMVTALTVLLLYAASILPVGRLPFLFLASVTGYILAAEGAFLFAYIAFFASGILAFCFLPDKTSAYAYCVLLGHYGVFRAVVQTKISSRLFRVLLKLLYCDACIVAGLYVAFSWIAGFSVVFPAWLPQWAVILLIQICVVLFDLLYGASAAIYENQLRHAILPRR